MRSAFKNASKMLISAVSVTLISLSPLSLNADVPDEVQAVFVNNGCLNCHSGANPSGGLSLDDAATSEMELVNINASCDGNQTLVIPGDPDNSVLYRKITMQNPGCGGVMPPGGNLISQADQNTIFDWIVSIGPAAQFGLIQLENIAVTVQETDADVTLVVNRQFGTQGTVTVDYAVATVGTNTATSPDDYIADAGTLTFADGVTQQTITVTLADDDVFEGTEEFSVTLSNIQNGAVLGSQVVTTVTIQDNEFDNQPGTFFFNRVNYSGNEGDATIDVTIVRSFGAAGIVTVDVGSADGSAVGGMDFNVVSETLQYQEGDRSAVFSIALLEDQEDEGNETFTLTLTNPGGGALLGNPQTVTVTIADNDGDTGGGDTGGGDTGGGTGGGDTGGGDTGGDTEPPEEEFTAAGGFAIWLILGLPLLLGLRRKK